MSEPQSRNEAILQATIDGTEYTDPPQSRIEDLLLQLKEAIEEGGGGVVANPDEPATDDLRKIKIGEDVYSIPEGGAVVRLPDVSGAAITTFANETTLTWTDPQDVVISGITFAKWDGTKVVRKIGSAPASVDDGDLVVDCKVRDQYSSTGFTDTGLTYGTTYYYRFFPYTDGAVYTDGSSVSATPERIVISTVPTQSGSLTYDGTQQTASFNDYDSSKMTVTGNTGTNAGSYTAQFTPKEGYCWSGGSTSAVGVSWSIGKATLTVPTQSGSITYDGTLKTASWDNNYDANKMNVSGNTGTNAGDYTATFSLIDTSNYQWSGATVDDKTAPWIIGKATGAFTLSKNSVTLNTSTQSDTVTATVTGDGTVSAVSSDTNVATVSVNGNTITISSVNSTTGTATITVSLSATSNYSAPANQTISVTAQFTTIYGIEWEGTSSPACSRTDASQNFSDPSPAVNNGNGSSPFDNLMPWSGMTVVEDATCGTMVRIPKFWYKWTRTGSKMKLQIADGQVDGFSVSPAHQARNSSESDRDYVLVGRYHCGSTNYKSVTGETPKNNITRDTARQAIHNLGSDVWQYDYAMLWTIQMLYLVEFAHWNSQEKIGYGCGNNSSTHANGDTDGMTYHTGTSAANRQTYGSVQYRHIENLWASVYDWIDGIYFSSTTIYGIKNPANYSDSTGGTNIGTRPSTSGCITGYTTPSASGFEWALYPSSVNGTDYSVYVCDRCYYNSSGVVLFGGGDYGQVQVFGLFFLNGNNGVSFANVSIGARLQRLPQAA